MKKIFVTLIAAVLMLMFNSVESHAFRGGHGGHFGVSVWVGPGLWWPYPYYSYYSPPPVVVEEQPELYMQQRDERQEENYWYYCPDPRGYYPYVKKCPKGWMKVVPSPAPSGPEE